jgi:hypothetical protein
MDVTTKFLVDEYLANFPSLENIAEILKWYKGVQRNFANQWSGIVHVERTSAFFAKEFCHRFLGHLFASPVKDWQKVVSEVSQMEKYILKTNGSFSPVPIDEDFAILKKMFLKFVPTAPLSPWKDDQPLQKGVLMSAFQPFLDQFFQAEKISLETHVDSLDLFEGDPVPPEYPVSSAIPLFSKMKISLMFILETGWIFPPQEVFDIYDAVMERYVKRVMLAVKRPLTTLDFCTSTLEKIAELLKYPLDRETYASQMFVQCTHETIQPFLAKLAKPLGQMKKQTWEKQPEDRSAYVDEISQILESFFAQTQQPFVNEKFNQLFFEKWNQALFTVEKIDANGCQQLLIDMADVKEVFLAHEVFTPFVKTSFEKIETLLKIVQSSPEDILTMYLSLVEHRSLDHLQKILLLKGMKRAAMQKILDTYKDVHRDETIHSKSFSFHTNINTFAKRTMANVTHLFKK